MGTKACKTCASAKRRCGKQTPNCLRCRTRGVKCTYPISKPSQFIILHPEEDDTSTQSNSLLNNNAVSFQNEAVPDLLPEILPNLSTSQITALQPHENFEEETPWFSTPSTWDVLFPAQKDFPSIPLADLKFFIATINHWLRIWIKGGSNPFIHARLYRSTLPPCMQDAYATLASYLGRGDGNEEIVNGIVERRMVGLVAEYQNSSLGAGNVNRGGKLDTMQHIARVQALLIYQVIALYDGNIRLRYLAESHIPILSSWLEGMVSHASQTSSITSLDNFIAMVEGIQESEKLWYDWIQTETIRRTWVVASGTQAVFKMAQQGGAVTCQGGMMFTTRKGAWEAESAVGWERLCCEVHVGLMQMAEAERLFLEGRPEEVNEFTMVVLRLVFGRERMERWGVGEGSCVS